MNKYQESLDRLGNIDLQTYPSIWSIDDFSLEDFPEPVYAGDCYDKDFENLQELIDKETPKKVITDGGIYGGTCDKVQYICPKCKQIMLRQVCTTAHTPNHCYKCGQALDWSENE